MYITLNIVDILAICFIVCFLTLWACAIIFESGEKTSKKKNGGGDKNKE